jgi:hypothetical protein
VDSEPFTAGLESRVGFECEVKGRQPATGTTCTSSIIVHLAMGPTGSVHGDAGFGRLEASHGVSYQGVTPLTWHTAMVGMGRCGYV